MVFVPGPPVGYADLGLRRRSAARGSQRPGRRAGCQDHPGGRLLEKLILIAIFVLACAGSAALLAAAWPNDSAGGRLALPARLPPGICYAWNPFVAERLIMGQWAMLLGYAGLPWVLREVIGAVPGAIAAVAARRRRCVPAAVGGFAAMSITVIAAVPVALCGTAHWPQRGRRLGVTLGRNRGREPSVGDPVAAQSRARRSGRRRRLRRQGRYAIRLARQPADARRHLELPGGPRGLRRAGCSVCWLAVVSLAGAGYVIAARPRRICPGAGVAAVARARHRRARADGADHAAAARRRSRSGRDSRCSGTASSSSHRWRSTCAWPGRRSRRADRRGAKGQEPVPG